MNHVMKLNFSGLRTPAQVAEKWLEMRLAVQLPYQQKVDDAIMSTWSVESHQEVSESPGINVMLHRDWWGLFKHIAKLFSQWPRRFRRTNCNLFPFCSVH